MSRASKKDYAFILYQEASRPPKESILNEFGALCSDQHAIRWLNRPRRRRKVCPDGAGAAEPTARKLCPFGRRLGRPRLFLVGARESPAAGGDAWDSPAFGFRAQTEPPLLGSSSRPLDYRGREKKRPPRRRLCGRTQPGTLRKPHLPRKTDPWDVQVPGFRESDRVWPSDYSAAGDFCSSLNRTDLHRGWAETRSVLGKSPEAVSSDWETIRQAFPFRWRGIDSAKGSEFSQDPRRRYGPAREVQFRRGRPYR